METVKLLDYLREHQDAEVRRVLARAHSQGWDDASVESMPRDLDGVDVVALADAVMAGANACYAADEGSIGRLELAYLDMSSSGSCVLGQAFGWGEGLAAMMPKSIYEGDYSDEDNAYVDNTEAYNGWITGHGFDIHSMHEVGDPLGWTYLDLSIAWEFVVNNLDRLEGYDGRRS